MQAPHGSVHAFLRRFSCAALLRSSWAPQDDDEEDEPPSPPVVPTDLAEYQAVAAEAARIPSLAELWSDALLALLGAKAEKRVRRKGVIR